MGKVSPRAETSWTTGQGKGKIEQDYGEERHRGFCVAQTISSQGYKNGREQENTDKGRRLRGSRQIEGQRRTGKPRSFVRDFNTGPSTHPEGSTQPDG